MSELPVALKARVPTLTEVLDAPEMPDLGDEPLWRAPAEAVPRLEPHSVLPGSVVKPHNPAQDPVGLDDLDQRSFVETVIASLAPQVEALVSSRLRDVLAPTIQEAVEEAIERCRQPLIEALKVQLREQLEQALPRPALQDCGHRHRPRRGSHGRHTAGNLIGHPAQRSGLAVSLK